jgi:hypothetical protein
MSSLSPVAPEDVRMLAHAPARPCPKLSCPALPTAVAPLVTVAEFGRPLGTVDST